jgi:hypothetical protein
MVATKVSPCTAIASGTSALAADSGKISNASAKAEDVVRIEMAPLGIAE